MTQIKEDIVEVFCRVARARIGAMPDKQKKLKEFRDVIVDVIERDDNLDPFAVDFTAAVKRYVDAAYQVKGNNVGYKKDLSFFTGVFASCKHREQFYAEMERFIEGRLYMAEELKEIFETIRAQDDFSERVIKQAVKNSGKLVGWEIEDCTDGMVALYGRTRPGLKPSRNMNYRLPG